MRRCSAPAPNGSAVSVTQGYGMTETSLACHVTPQDPAKVRSGAVGLTLPNMESKSSTP